jgi:histidinol phosphatase-like enzyme (inositol monophosphatase family)
VNEAFLATAHALADEARAVSLRWFRTPLAVESKADHSPVTEADRGVEALLRKRLAERHPEHGVCGEEFGRDRADADFVWYLDPIDGTKSFISGLPLWGTMLALVERGAPVLGLVDIPATGERWSALRGHGAWFDPAGARTRCATSRCRELAQARLALPAPDAFLAAEVDAVRTLAERVALRRYGGDCYAYGLVAGGHLDLVVESGLDDHDFLPMVVLVEEAGGVITDWRGRALTPDSDGDVPAAATPALHRQALEALGDR